jgi:hypothetical protein
MYFSWAIYTPWNPRTLYPFANYFFSLPYIVSIISLYLLLIGGAVVMLKERAFRFRRDFWIITIVFVIAAFFSKGAQNPFGEVFLFFYNHVPFFSVFRTSDIRFGFVMIICLAMLAVMILPALRRRIFVYLFIGITLMQSWPFFTGKAIRGENIDGLFYDRTIVIPQDYKDTAAFINADPNRTSYILPLPAIEYGNYELENDNHLVGQDILAKLVEAPFIYVSSSAGMASSTYLLLKGILEVGDFEKLSIFPIKYLILRRDISCTDCKYDIGKISKVADLAYENPSFRVFKMKNYPFVVDSPNVVFRRLNPVRYQLTFANLRSVQELSLLQNFNTNWKLYSTGEPVNCGASDCTRETKIGSISDFHFLFSPPIAENTHKLAHGYGNSWSVDPAMNNKEGSSFSLDLIYYPQIEFFFAGLFSLLTTIGMSLFLVIDSRRSRKLV